MRHRRTVATWALALAALLVLGCVGPFAGAGAMGAAGWSRNEVRAEYGADLERTWQAALGALDDYNYPIPPGVAREATAGEVASRDVWVRVEAMGAEGTRVRVRVGKCEEDAEWQRARLLMRGIARRLSVPPPPG